MIYAVGYPMAIHMIVVIKAIFKDFHKTPGKIGSEKNRAKLSNVIVNVSTLFPCTVNAYKTIISIGTMIIPIIHTMYG